MKTPRPRPPGFAGARPEPWAPSPFPADDVRVGCVTVESGGVLGSRLSFHALREVWRSAGHATSTAKRYRQTQGCVAMDRPGLPCPRGLGNPALSAPLP